PPCDARRTRSTPRTPSPPHEPAEGGAARSDSRRTPSTPGRGAAGSRSFRPHVLEGAEAQLLEVVHARLVAALEVLLLVHRDEVVVRVDRLPAIDHHVAVGLLHVAQQLRADEPRALPEELRPVAVRAVDARERPGIADVVAEDERDHLSPPRSWCA